MTYQEYFNEKRSEFEKATQQLFTAEKKLTDAANGFFDKKLMDDYVKAKIYWQNTANSYNTFLDFCMLHQINPKDDMI